MKDGHYKVLMFSIYLSCPSIHRVSFDQGVGVATPKIFRSHNLAPSEVSNFLKIGYFS